MPKMRADTRPERPVADDEVENIDHRREPSCQGARL
jgi:hypothetical protein